MESKNTTNKGQQFLELSSIFSIDNYKNDLITYYDFLEKQLPEFLYKYCSVSEYSIPNLITNSACFTNPNLFNDPFDSGANLSRQGAKDRLHDINTAVLKLKTFKDSNNDIKKIYEQLDKKSFFQEKDYRKKLTILRQTLFQKDNEDIIRNNLILSGIKMKTDRIYSNTGDPNTNRKLGDIADNVRIFCLSESENNTLMWAHYGQNDSGFCVKYSKNSILEFLKSRDDIFMVPVCYTDRNQFLGDVPFEASPLELLKFFMIKKEDWSYEHEWRLIQYCPNYYYNPCFGSNLVAALSAPCSFPDYHNLSFVDPKEIYLGSKFDIHKIESEKLKDIQKDFFTYLENNYSKFKSLSICDQILGYYVNDLY